MKRTPADEGAQQGEVEGCKGEKGKVEVMIGRVDVALVIVVVVVDGRVYGGLYYLDGVSSLAKRLNCEGGGKIGKRCEARF